MAALAGGLLMLIAIACGGDDADPNPQVTAGGGDATPTNRLSLASTRKAASGLSIDTAGIRITVSRVSIADYAEMYAAADGNARQALEAAPEARGAQTVGLFELAIENTTGGRLSFDPAQGSASAGNETVRFSPPFSSDLSGEYAPGTVKRGLLIFFIKGAPASSIAEVVYSLPVSTAASPPGRPIQMRFNIEP